MILLRTTMSGSMLDSCVKVGHVLNVMVVVVVVMLLGIGCRVSLCVVMVVMMMVT